MYPIVIALCSMTAGLSLLLWQRQLRSRRESYIRTHALPVGVTRQGDDGAFVYCGADLGGSASACGGGADGGADGLFGSDSGCGGDGGGDSGGGCGGGGCGGGGD